MTRKQDRGRVGIGRPGEIALGDVVGRERVVPVGVDGDARWWLAMGGALLCVLACLVLLTPAMPIGHAQVAPVRHKPGPVFMRGVAERVRGGGFDLHTTHRGIFSVSILPATRIDELGRKGVAVLRNGDHVGVRGFVTGRQIRAIHVRIYPVKPRSFTVQGVVQAVRGGSLLVGVGGKSVAVLVTARTVIHIGNAPGVLGQVRPGDRVELRVEAAPAGLSALHVHIYRRRVVGRPLRIQGTITATGGGDIVVVSGSGSYQVAISAQTRFYLGSRHGQLRDVRAGQQVTVYACCVGHTLTATSVHIRMSRLHPTTVLLHGVVLSITPSHLAIAVGRANMIVVLQPSTIYQVGSSPASYRDIHVGDHVSVRAYQLANGWQARRVHVEIAFRRPHTVEGRVLAVSRAGLTVLSHGRHSIITIRPGTTVLVSGRPAALSSVRVGDRVRAVGHVDASGQLTADRIEIKHVPPQLSTVRGTVLTVQGSDLVIADSLGIHHRVHLESGTRLLAHHQPVAASALFPGVPVTARGQMAGSLLQASTVTISVRPRTVTGQLRSRASAQLVLHPSSGADLHVYVSPGLLVTDGRRHLRPSSLHIGAFLQIRGWEAPSGALRATSAALLHPLLDLTGTLAAGRGGSAIQTTRGDLFLLLVSSSTQILASPGQVEITLADIPVGAPIHVQGVVDSDGRLLVRQMTARLAALTLQGRVAAIAAPMMTVQVAGQMQRVRLGILTGISQGEHTLAVADVVVGDEVTVYGYQARTVLLARKILVHRKLIALDGTVAALTSDGFLVAAADGDHRIMVSNSTIITGEIDVTVAVGAPIHVTGYLRGDGVILATRVRPGKKGKAARDYFRSQARLAQISVLHPMDGRVEAV